MIFYTIGLFNELIILTKYLYLVSSLKNLNLYFNSMKMKIFAISGQIVRAAGPSTAVSSDNLFV